MMSPRLFPQRSWLFGLFLLLGTVAALLASSGVQARLADRQWGLSALDKRLLLYESPLQAQASFSQDNSGYAISHVPPPYKCGQYPIHTGWSDTLNRRRVRAVAGGVGGLVGGMYAGLSVLWYADNWDGQFRFFDDWREWKQIDKVGHLYGAYQQSRIIHAMLGWAGVPEKKRLLWGTLSGFLIQTPIEIMDGFSPKYGASATDAAFNALGSAWFLLNELVWGEQRLQVKWSFLPTDWADRDPALLGETLLEQPLKDYNGQAYWLSIPLDPWLPEGKIKDAFPDWLAISLGYGADGMLGGYGQDPWDEIEAREFRQWYLGVDIDFTRIHTRHKWLNSLLFALNMVRLPLPAVEFSSRGVHFRPFGQ